VRPADLPYGALLQCDGTTCGSACLVVARMVVDPTAAASLLDPTDRLAARFAVAQRAVHRRTGALHTAGGWAVPWPRSFGTTPWGLARELRALAPGYRTVLLDPDSPDERRRLLDRLGAAVVAGRPAALVVGSDLAPRHVVLALPAGDGGLRCYEPSAGAVVELDRDTFVDGPLQVAGWSRVWAAVTR
jgi:hypothetical protein